MSATTPAAPLPTFGEACARFGGWCRERPLQAALLTGCLATLVYFFFIHRVWVLGAQSTARWTWQAWNKQGGEQFHGLFVLPVSLWLLWYHRGRLAAAARSSSWLGLAGAGLGVMLFVVGVRCLQPRMALVALPLLGYGATRFLWGRETARVILFPCAFLLFMLPVEALQNLTFPLQFAITGAIGLLSRLVGISILAEGTNLWARDGSFEFEIAEGCSGIRSLVAMSMLTAIYVHLTQDAFWKKAVVFAASLVFALVGNIGRLFTVILFARFISPKFAGTLYHDYSGFLFFPIALVAMTGFARLVNLDWPRMWARAMQREAPLRVEPGETPAPERPPEKPRSPITYDY